MGSQGLDDTSSKYPAEHSAETGSPALDDTTSKYPAAEFVAAAFVEQYYRILHQSPQEVYQFYEDNSVLGRPEADGEMTNVTTMKTINEKIMSLDYKDSLVTIVNVNAQRSIMDGVIVGVRGFLSRKDELKRNFTQTFFLARHKTGYFVLNDFLYFTDLESAPVPLPVLTVQENTLKTKNSAVTEPTLKVSGYIETKSTPVEQVAISAQSETKSSVEQGVGSDHSKELKKNSVEQEAVSDRSKETKMNSSVEQNAVSDQSKRTMKSTSVEQDAVSDQSKRPMKTTSVEQVAISKTLANKSLKITEMVIKALDVQTKSYASVLGKEKNFASPDVAPVSISKVPANRNQQQPCPSALTDSTLKRPVSAPQLHVSTPPHLNQQARASAPNRSAALNASSVTPRSSGHPNEGAHLNNNVHGGATSIYIGGLPRDINHLKLKAAVEVFGPVKQDGIQIRRCQDGFAFGFVEFESPKSAQDAIEAHTITFGEKESYITFKKSNLQAASHVSGQRGNFPSSGGGGYLDGNPRNVERNRSNSDGYPIANRGYNSGQSGPRGYSSGPARGGSFVRNGDGNRRGFYQNYNGGGARPLGGAGSN